MEANIKAFFDREDVSRVYPDTRKVAYDPATPKVCAQIRYRLSYLKLLHVKFIAETTEDCCYETFTRHVPYYIRKPAAEDWGTCLCVTCLNPELKIDRLQRLEKIAAVNIEDAVSCSDKFDQLVEDLSNLKPDSEKEKKKKVLDDILNQQELAEKRNNKGTERSQKKEYKEERITFTEWTMEKYKTKKGKTASRSRKVHVTLSIAAFVNQLIKELTALKDHLHRAHIQYRAFKDKS